MVGICRSVCSTWFGMYHGAFTLVKRRNKCEIYLLHWSRPSPTAHKTVHEGLEYHKVCARWAPTRLMRQRTNRRFDVATSYIQRLAKQDTSSRNPQWQATRHECITSFLKQNSLECAVRKHANARTSHNFKVYPSARKVTESVFWDAEAVIYISVSRATRRMGHAATSACGYWQRGTAHAMKCDPAARHCNPTKSTTIHGNFWAIHATGPDLESSTPS